MVSMTRKLDKTDLITLFIGALRTESYRYAEILRLEIENRCFTEYEMQLIRNSDYYAHLNGLFENQER